MILVRCDKNRKKLVDDFIEIYLDIESKIEDMYIIDDFSAYALHILAMLMIHNKSSNDFI